MNISQSSNFFQLNKQNPFSRKFGLPIPLKGNVLNEVANKAAERKQINCDFEFKSNIKEIDLDTYAKTQYTGALEEFPPEVLEYYSASLKFLSNLSSDQEEALSSFKEQLITFDKQIQSYQDMADGKASLPEGVTSNDINNLLAKTQKSREKYLEEGLKKINKWDLYKSDFFNRTVNTVFGENKFTESSGNWKIDMNASDIYAEIDKVINSTRGVTQTLNEGISRIHDILERRGYGDTKYNLHQTVSPSYNTQLYDTDTADDLALLLASIKNKTQV
ncbi:MULTISPECIES: hypothetical protein [Lacrimispora]|jgi:hypothetical protein|uniref:hypothetical protein n=1 Tax=Lacrimispora TaxID=2719231 RepID=UPI000BE3F2E2|nr:hypothetical protein [Lacrimispora amygdalina]MDK2965704.1 hypothetical protein [Lacrimispora sp.]